MKLLKPIMFCLLTACIFNHAVAAFLPPAQATVGMVASQQALATRVGVNILRQGGNAIDAAVAVGYALAVTAPCCGNIGGGGFMLIHLHSGRNIFLDFRETSPNKLTPSMFLSADGKVDKTLLLHSYLGVGVPGTVLGLNTALKKYGTMSLNQVITPAIKLAKDGFRLTLGDVKFLNIGYEQFKKQENTTHIFTHAGQRYRVGEILRQPQLAKTLTIIRQEGAKAFYQGAIAQRIVAASRQHNGVITLKDLAEYQVKIRQPVHCRYHGYIIYTSPPPGSGTTVCEILNILEPYSLEKMGFHSAASLHLNLAAMQMSFYDRNHYLADPAFTRIPKQLLTQQYAKTLRQRILPDKALGESYSPAELIGQPHEKMQTTQYSIIDRYGNAVSVTYTLNGYFGSYQIPGDTGFFLNNELADFAIIPKRPNYFKLVQGKLNVLAPGKRPLSSMSPTIMMYNSHPYVVLGAAGGSTIITSIVEAIENLVNYHMNVNAAINMPRFHFQGLPDKVFYEPYCFTKDTANKLIAMGYQLQLGGLFGCKQWGQMAIVKFDKDYYGANDNRRPAGLAAGVDANH